ncbi:MAG: hypothetical protein ACHQ53_12065 [Polyangiales bacterium]
MLLERTLGSALLLGGTDEIVLVGILGGTDEIVLVGMPGGTDEIVLVGMPGGTDEIVLVGMPGGTDEIVLGGVLVGAGAGMDPIGSVLLGEPASDGELDGVRCPPSTSTPMP